jgi:Tfp pilus assembly protein PilN
VVSSLTQHVSGKNQAESRFLTLVLVLALVLVLVLILALVLVLVLAFVPAERRRAV